MAYLEGYKSGYDSTVNPFAALLNEVDAGYKRRRAEDKQREEEDRKLRDLFAKMKVEADNAKELQKMKGEQDIESEYHKGVAQGKIRPKTPMAAVGQAMQPQAQSTQAGFTPTTMKSPGGAEYETIEQPEDYKRGLEIKKLEGELKEGEEKNTKVANIIKESAMDNLNTIKNVEDGINNFGMTGGIPSFPGTKRANWEANVNKLLSGKVLDLMTKLKEASKTGATGFGQLSNKELIVLQEASTALKKTLSPKDAKVYLNQMKEKLQKVASGDGGQEQSNQQSSKLTPEQRQELINKIRNKNGG